MTDSKNSRIAGGGALIDDALLAAMELASEGTLVLNNAGHIVFASKPALSLMRHAGASLEGLDFWETVSEEAESKHHAESVRALKSVHIYTFAEHNAFEGTWLEYRLTIQAAATVVTIRDVTDQQMAIAHLDLSEQRNEALFGANPNPMWVFQIEGLGIVAANTAATDFYGYFGDEFLKLHVDDLYPLEDRPELASLLPGATLDSALRGGAQLCRNLKKNGDVALVELTGCPLEWEGTPAVLVSVSDVTARYMADSTVIEQNAELERRVEQLNEEVAQLNRELQSYNYAMSHDLQSPLHIADGFAKTLIARYASVLDEQGLHYLSRIQASSQRMARMIDDLRVLTRVSRVAMSVQPVDAAELCVGILDVLRQREPARTVELEIDGPLPVMADRSLLISALTCLLENAWKFTSKRPQAWIKVGFAPSADDAERILQVSDNGAGFDGNYVQKLFTPFQRLHSSADFPGTGLGLAIVQRVAARHAGRVWAESESQSESVGGASFYIALPQTPVEIAGA